MKIIIDITQLHELSEQPTYNVGLKTLLRKGLSEPEIYGDLVYKFKKLIGRNDFFSVQKNHSKLQTYTDV